MALIFTSLPNFWTIPLKTSTGAILGLYLCYWTFLQSYFCDSLRGRESRATDSTVTLNTGLWLYSHYDDKFKKQPDSLGGHMYG